MESQNSASNPASLEDPSEAKFSVERNKVRQWRKAPVREIQYKMIIEELPKTKCPLTRFFDFEKVLKGAFDQIIADAPPDSMAQIFAVNDRLNKRCIATERMMAKDLTFTKFAERLCAVIKSDESVRLEDTNFYLSTYTKTTVGGKRKGCNLRNRHEYNKLDWACRKRSMYDPMANKNRVPKSMENLCVPLIIARELLWLASSTKGRSTIANFVKTKPFHLLVKKVIESSGLNNKTGPYTLEQLVAFEESLPEGYGLNFFDDTAPPFLKLGKKGSPRSINIFIDHNNDPAAEAHYHAFGITSMTAFMGADKVCLTCFRGYSDNGFPHKCTLALCQLCKNDNCTNRDGPVSTSRCELCELPFRTPQCLTAHETQCKLLKLCELCGERCPEKTFQKHNCGKPYCSQCRINHSPFEYCSVQSPRESKTNQPVIWYADMETQVDPETKNHHANLIVLQRQDGGLSYEFQGPDAVTEFLRACIAEGSAFANSFLVFHNGAGFDVHLLWEQMWKAGILPHGIIRKQQKIISLEFNQNGIKCRDSLQFLPGTSLASFPKMFGLASGPKGDFPHGLNCPKWVQFGQRIVYKEVVDGHDHRFPPLKYFWPEMKRPGPLQELKDWHQAQVAKFCVDPTLQYIPEDELIAYCRQDVRILREGFESFRATCLDQYPDLEPLESLTFPSFNNKILRAKYMAKNSLSLLPPQGYESGNHRYSKAALAWIAWMEQALGLTGVRSARKGGEVRISGHKVDATGVDARGQRHVLEFHGCYWHGHDCIPRTPELDSKRHHTIRTETRLKSLSVNPNSPYGIFEYHSIYECQFQQQARNNREMKLFIEDYIMRFPQEPLKIRDSMRGGRTNAIKHRIESLQEGWIIRYYDFTSLYPAVNFGINGEVWPIGHPQIYIGKDLEKAPSPEHWFGFAKLDIAPPRNLVHPVLGQLINDKLLFHLCTACATMLHEGLCEHNDMERCIHGTFFTGEIQLAVEMGYTILGVQELWHWPKEQRSEDLFRSFIRDQYAKKALASAVPKDPVELQKLIDEYRDTMDLELKPEQFKENKAIRAFAKFCLNNVWGYFAKRENNEKTECASNVARWMALEQDRSIKITSLSVSEDEEHLLISHKSLEERAGRNGNIAVAAMTTAYARIALYKVIRQYPDHVAYFDTDSVILYLPPGVEPPPTSTVLGGLKDEILETYGAGAYISNFYSIGPKSYSYRVEKDGVLVEEVVKMKGISFTAEASKTVTREAMEELTEHKDQQLMVPQYLIRKNFAQTRLFNAEMLKKVRFQSTKRWILPTPEMDTRPYGYSGL